jgi:hypothetical protein
MVVRVTARATERLRCAVCHGESARDQLVQCGACASSCHPDCLAANEGCPSLACPRSKPRPQRPAPVQFLRPGQESLVDPDEVADRFRVAWEVCADVGRFLLFVGRVTLGGLVVLALVLCALTLLAQLLR